jgi:hypothetical protein
VNVEVSSVSGSGFSDQDEKIQEDAALEISSKTIVK